MSRSILPLLLLFSPVIAAGEDQLENGRFTAELNGFKIHYQIQGSGPVLMTLPNSWGITIEGLRPLFQNLERDLTLVYFDPRGMGKSDPVRRESDRGMPAVREDFHALRKHLGLDTVNAIGWSNGAMNLLLLASETPEALRSAIFVHGAASYSSQDGQVFVSKYPQVVEPYLEYQRQLSDGTVDDETKNASLRRFWLESLLPLSCFDPSGGKQLVSRLLSKNSFSWRHADYSRQEASEFDFTDRLAQITVPSLILAGVADTVPTQKARDMQFGIPDARLVIFEKSGHYAPVEEPEAFRQAVLDFLDGLDDGE